MRAKKPLILATAAAVGLALVLPAPAEATPTAAPTRVSQDVIVILRDQHTNVPNTRANQTRRASVIKADQDAVVNRAVQLGGKNVHRYQLINALSLSLESTDVAALAADPSVASVVPDRMLKLPRRTAETAAQGAAAATTAAPNTPANICPTNPSKPLHEPEALQTMNVESVNGNGGAHAITRGEGVRVGYLADGLDPQNPDFVRNGKSIFSDYQDFTTDGADAPTSGAEAFGDASGIAAQGNVTYSLNDFVNSSKTLPKGCTIKVVGVAPGADLVGLKVFGLDGAPTSRFIQAVDYATNKAHVDVLNESFGGNPYPDTQDDPISLANNAAIAAGVTVVASTGDAGITNTIGSPATSKDVIGVGATTIFRSYLQTGDGFTALPGVKSWASDNISQISSAGFAQNGKVPDVVAPGDSGWAVCSADPTRFVDCTNFKSTPTPSSIQQFGGTSQSSPLTSGTAALVIAAYRIGHPGQGDPSPALVKRLITSTARDLGHPAQLQGAGEVNAEAAVKAALSVPADGSSKRPGAAQGSALLLSKTQLDLNGKAGAKVSATVKVTNLSATRQKLSAKTRTLSRTVRSGSGTVIFKGSALPTILNLFGAKRAYTARTITVGKNVDRLDASAAFQSDDYVASLVLVDPKGVYTSYSLAQGLSNYSHVDARHPVAGKWKLFVVANPLFSGTVKYSYQQRAFATAGKVKLSSSSIGAGKTVTVKYSTRLGRNPGDTAASVQLKAGAAQTSVPVSLRSAISTSGNKVSTFAGSVTGGNGRGDDAQSRTYSINVGKNAPQLSVGIKLKGQTAPNELVLGYLVSPQGQPLAAQSNGYLTKAGLVDSAPGLQLFARAPSAGRWTLVLELVNPTEGTAVSQPFTGYVSVARSAVVSTPKLPNSKKAVLKAGKAVQVKVRVTNSGVVPRSFFADPRLTSHRTYTLASQNPGDNQKNKDLLDFNYAAQYLVPTRSSSISFHASSNQPIQLDASWNSGDPEVSGRASTTNTSTATLSTSRLAQGPWVSQASPIGPFTTKTAKAGKVSYSATVESNAFDPAVLSSTGDYWLTALIPAPAGQTVSPARAQVNPARSRWTTGKSAAKVSAALASAGPLTLNPGQSGTITVQITPSSAKGTVVKGTLDVDTFDPVIGSGDEVRALPYQYTVG